ncbi:MAG: hypothetical protein IPO00_16530, partial [Betaproteobacteria bacterium]|nr:hypothetical protein [Betaproteobacteria bacterium]
LAELETNFKRECIRAPSTRILRSMQRLVLAKQAETNIFRDSEGLLARQRTKLLLKG